MELGSHSEDYKYIIFIILAHSEVDCLLLQVPTAGPRTVFATLFHTAVERASCGEHMLLRTVEVVE